MTTAEARERVGAARLAIVSARHHHGNLDKAMDALTAAVRAEERASIVKALNTESERMHGAGGDNVMTGIDFSAAASFVESLDRGEG